MWIELKCFSNEKMRGVLLKKIVFLFVFTIGVLQFVFATSENEDYIYWYTSPFSNAKTHNGSEFKEVLSHSNLPFGTKVEITVNGISKELTVNDRPLDRRATFGTDSATARFLGFYPYLRENVSFRIIQMGDDVNLDGIQKRNTLYKITSLYPKDGDDLISLSMKLINEGFKTEVNEKEMCLEVSFIPYYQLDSEMEVLKEYIDSSIPLKSIQMYNI